MKKWMILSGVVAMAGSICMAETPVAANGKTGPCKEIVQACQSAGFEKGDHKKDGKGLYKDCLKPILDGQSVPGVAVDPTLVSACSERRAKRHERKAHDQTPAPAAAPVK